MGMYTEFIFGCELSKATPRVCVEALDYVINGEEKKPKYEDPKNWEEEEFNKNYIERTLEDNAIKSFIDQYDFWRLFKCSSYYFGAANPIGKFYYDHISDSYHISTRADLKNYEDQIETFIDYIKPFVKNGSGDGHQIFAYAQYEEDEFPTIYGIDGVYHVMDPEIERTVVERENKRWEIFRKLYRELAPDYEVTEEECAKHNIEPGKETIEDTWEWMVDYIINKYKSSNT